MKYCVLLFCDRSIASSIGDFSTRCDLVLPISNYATFYFAELHPVAAYAIFLVFSLSPCMYKLGRHNVIIVFSVRITDTHSRVPEISGVPKNFVRGGGVQQIQLRTEDRENGDLGGGTPLIRGSGGRCNLVQEISFYIVKFS